MKARGRYRHGIAALALAACMALVACGSDDDSNGDDAASSGGSVTIAQTSQPDALDPALSYTQNAWEALWLVYTPPVTYKRVDGEEGTDLIPGLASSLPEVSDDGKTYTFTLRDGLKYSDGRPVKASDFEHSVKRVLNLESGGSGFFEVIEGATAFLENGDPQADIPGIETDDETGEVTIRLTEPDGTFTNVLAMPFAAPVPASTPFKNMSADPPAGVGPYKITKSVPNREFVLQKVKSFDVAGIPAGNLDTITTKIVKNTARQAQDVMRGDLDYMQDPLPPDIRPEVEERYSDRYRTTVTTSTYYFFLNSRVPPFDDPKVREAVNFGVDKTAIARLYGGDLAPGCSYLPPTMPGYDEAFDHEDCPWGDPREAPDLAKARKLIEDAGAENAKVTVWGNGDGPTPQVTEAYADMLRKIGLDATTKIVDGAVYFQVIGNAKTEAQTGFANWFQDFPHPKNFLFHFQGSQIAPTNNQNYGNVDDPEINREVARLSRVSKLTPEVAGQWGDVNEKLVERAWIVPFGFIKLPTFLSERMDFENCSRFHPVYYNDYSDWCLKQDQ